MTTLKKQLIDKYKTKFFVETGTGSGSGFLAGAEFDFERLISVEIDKSLYVSTKQLISHRKDKRMRMIYGDSEKCLNRCLEFFDDKILFWLDAHGYKVEGKDPTCPILKELSQIAADPIKEHTIFIDDWFLIRNKIGWAADLNKEDVVAAVMNINPDYKITYEDSILREKDILVATI